MKGQLNDYVFTYGPDFIDVTGAFRIRQVRVQATPCANKYLQNLTCYPEYGVNVHNTIGMSHNMKREKLMDQTTLGFGALQTTNQW